MSLYDDDDYIAIDEVEKTIKLLNGRNWGFSEELNLREFAPNVWLVLNQISNYGTEDQLGINRSLFRRLVDNKKTTQILEVKIALEHVRNMLRNLEEVYATVPTSKLGTSNDNPQSNKYSLEAHDSAPHSNNGLKITSEKWVYVVRTPDIRENIAVISSLLTEVIVIVSKTNATQDQLAIIDIERQQLIAVLETALAMLKGPMVEPGLLKKLAEISNSVLKKSVEKKVETALGVGLGKLTESIWLLLSKL